MKLNPLQEALVPHVSEQEYQKMLAEAKFLEAENARLKDRVNHLESEIATHAFGGWKIH